jgi:putative glycosyltransferase
MLAALDKAGIQDFEFVFVNDGSPDASLERLLQMRSADDRLKIVDLSRNFGHHKAALAGLAYARGDLVFIIDCDLEVPPSVFGNFYETIRSTGADVVYGTQRKRKGRLVERLGGGVFWKLFNRLSDTTIPENVLTERLMRRTYVDALLSLGDRNIFLAGMMYWAGFRQVGIVIDKQTREGGSTYSLRKRLSLLIEAITSFSTVPLKLVLVFGMLLTISAMLFAAGILIQKLLYPSMLLAGFTTLTLLILGLGGITITLMGVLGLYISRIFVQTQGRPAFIVREFHDKGNTGR